MNCGPLARIWMAWAAPEATLRVVAYADDVTVFVFSHEEAGWLMSEVDRYSEASESKINQDKYTLPGPKVSAKVLGIKFGQGDYPKQNWDSRLEIAIQKEWETGGQVKDLRTPHGHLPAYATLVLKDLYLPKSYILELWNRLKVHKSSRPRFRNFSSSRSRSRSTKSNAPSDEYNIPHPESSKDQSGSRPSTKKIVTRQTSKTKNATGKQQGAGTSGGLQVLNLSTRSFTEAQIEVLGRGLNFSPTNPFDFVTAMKDLHLFSRKLILKKLHSKNYFSHESVTGTEIKALQALEDLLEEQITAPQDVVFKPADKGGNIVIWPCHKYEKEAFCQLRDATTYTKLAYNPMASFSSQLQTILGRALDGGIIDKKPLVEALPSYVKDTTDVLSRVDGVLVDPGVLLVDADVQTLYTCIDREHGLAATLLFLGASDLGGPLCDFILELLRFVLTHNFFVFEDTYYLQKRGTAMGAACAPSYANLFLGFWERSIFGDVGAQSADHVLCWMRYIDDVLFLWGRTAQQLREFMNRLNNNSLNIKLTYQFDYQQIDFLDVTLEIDDTRRIQTDVFRKSTAVNALVRADSAHNSSTIRAVPVGQFLRMRRICSTDNRFLAQAEDLKGRFEARGYSRRTIKRGFERARRTPQRDLLYPKATGQETRSEGDKIRFITTYNHEWSSMRDILN
ncbi:unnamed protein product [Ranitomeya imitator]|uniref:Helix-turn-helix domain-containing protein n=1 Tax=Ranitomeya imitator TaxID=111125 RepID=A0ABN9LUG3_9NEOB|nr:unnamed protein product [Ranitomeya imitator]